MAQPFRLWGNSEEDPVNHSDPPHGTACVAGEGAEPSAWGVLPLRLLFALNGRHATLQAGVVRGGMQNNIFIVVLEKMTPAEHLRSMYDRFGPPDLANFSLCDLDDAVTYDFGAFALADHDGWVVLIRRTPIKEYPAIEKYWWTPGGAREEDEQLDEAVMREFEEETGLRISISRILLAQLAEDRPFIAVVFRGAVVGGTVSPDSDPDRITSEARTFPPRGVPFDRIWMDQDKILLVQEGFATGPIDDLITKNGLEGRHNH